MRLGSIKDPITSLYLRFVLPLTHTRLHVNDTYYTLSCWFMPQCAERAILQFRVHHIHGLARMRSVH